MTVGRVVVALAGAFVAVTLAAGGRAQAPGGVEGTWKLDPAKSTFSPGPAPRAMTMTYSRVGTDGVRIVVDVMPREGPAQHREVTVHYDGIDHRVTGDPGADTVMSRRVDDRTYETTFKKDGKVTTKNTRRLSADGRMMTITSTGTTADGKPRKDVQVFEKQ